jgi:hypothetical protein
MNGVCKVFRPLAPALLCERAKGCAHALLRITLISLRLALLVAGCAVLLPVVWLVRRLQPTPTIEGESPDPSA